MTIITMGKINDANTRTIIAEIQIIALQATISVLEKELEEKDQHISQLQRWGQQERNRADHNAIALRSISPTVVALSECPAVVALSECLSGNEGEVEEEQK